MGYNISMVDLATYDNRRLYSLYSSLKGEWFGKGGHFLANLLDCVNNTEEKVYIQVITVC